MSIHDVPTTGNRLPPTIPHDAGNGAPSPAVSTLVPTRTRVASTRKRVASQANGRKSHGPVTPEGKLRSSQNARKPLERLLGLAEARTLHHEPGAALKLYRELIAPYEPAPALLARHFQDLARLYLELEASESIRDALLDHRAQQNTIEVRSRYREMDAELDVPLKEVFERGLRDLPDSPAKLKKELECLDMLKEALAGSKFDAIGPALRQLYGNELNPKGERAKLICIDCERLMDPSDTKPVSEHDIHELLFLIEQEKQHAEKGYELELDKRTVTGSASVSFLAPRRKDQWLHLQAQRLRQAIDRKQWVISGLLQTPMMVRLYGAKAVEEAQGNREDAGKDQPLRGAGHQPPGGAGGRPRGKAKHAAGVHTPGGYARNAKTNPRSTLESTKVLKNEPKTNLNEPRTNPGPSGPAQDRSRGIITCCGCLRRATVCCFSGRGCTRRARRVVEAARAATDCLTGRASSERVSDVDLKRLRAHTPYSPGSPARLPRAQASLWGTPQPRKAACCLKGNTVNSRRWSAAEPTESMHNGLPRPWKGRRCSPWVNPFGVGDIRGGYLIRRLKPAAIYGRSLRDRTRLRTFVRDL